MVDVWCRAQQAYCALATACMEIFPTLIRTAYVLVKGQMVEEAGKNLPTWYRRKPCTGTLQGKKKKNWEY